MALNLQARAILWAQWRSWRNVLPRARRGSLLLAAVGSLVWYGLWILGAVASVLFLSETTDRERAYSFLAGGLMIALLYWQLLPVLMVSTGASLEIKKLLVYPIPHSELFQLELLLRFSNGLEMLILLSGMSLGLALSPVLNAWLAGFFLPFLAFNLFLAAGVRQTLIRFFSQNKTREWIVFLLALLATVPQLALLVERSDHLFELWRSVPSAVWPWTATAHLVTGDLVWSNWIAMIGWLAASYAFGRWMFEKGLRFDEDAARARAEPAATACWTDWLFQWPHLWLRDPLAVLVEKELRSLFRSPAFRLLFLMGFTFGVLIWFPMRYRGSFSPDRFFVIVCVYAILLLSDTLIWNYFGFDRGATAWYFLAPVGFGDVVIAKNIAAVALVVFELGMITVVCFLAGLIQSWQAVLDGYLVSLTILVYLLGIGNWSSLKYPRPSDPNRSWRRGNPGRFRFLLLLIYPLLGAPFAFAYFAREVWESNSLFYAIVGALAALGAGCYGFFLETALNMAREEKESFLRELAETETPISSLLQG
ncbi:MAG: hypothetical protein NZV14_07555 [Bryobacteraceae bacterium]|nr:hypothetical protein [Bryobacteraceae bacterium]MDW8378001.1 hypothetical protein [Bryobacterales bacterium]